MTEANWQKADREWREARQKREVLERPITRICQVAFILAIIAVGIGVRLLIVQGEWNCFWVEEAGHCMAVAGVGK